VLRLAGDRDTNGCIVAALLRYYGGAEKIFARLEIGCH